MSASRKAAAAFIIAFRICSAGAAPSAISGEMPRDGRARNGYVPGMGIRVAAAGDVHADASRRNDLEAAFTNLRGRADVVLLAGDLTTHGRPGEAQVLADASQLAGLPVFGVLGNHDCHSNRAAEVSAVMQEAGVTMLDRSWATREIDGMQVGIVGTKGFVGGFPGSHLPDFGEPLLREIYAETGRE